MGDKEKNDERINPSGLSEKQRLLSTDPPPQNDDPLLDVVRRRHARQQKEGAAKVIGHKGAEK